MARVDYEVGDQIVGGLRDEGRRVGPLEVAVCQSDVTLVKILLRAGAKHEQGVLQGFNLVSLAAFAGDFDIMAILAEHGADLDHCNEDGENCTTLLQKVHGLTWESALPFSYPFRSM